MQRLYDYHGAASGARHNIKRDDDDSDDEEDDDEVRKSIEHSALNATASHNNGIPPHSRSHTQTYSLSLSLSLSLSTSLLVS